MLQRHADQLALALGHLGIVVLGLFAIVMVFIFVFVVAAVIVAAVALALGLGLAVGADQSASIRCRGCSSLIGSDDVCHDDVHGALATQKLLSQSLELESFIVRDGLELDDTRKVSAPRPLRRSNATEPLQRCDRLS